MLDSLEHFIGPGLKMLLIYFSGVPVSVVLALLVGRSKRQFWCYFGPAKIKDGGDVFMMGMTSWAGAFILATGWPFMVFMEAKTTERFFSFLGRISKKLMKRDKDA